MIAVVLFGIGEQLASGRNMYPVLGRPLMIYPLLAARHAHTVDTMAISTNSPAMAQVAQTLGASVILRPPELCSPQVEMGEVFRHAVAMISDVVTEAFHETGHTAADIQWFVPHQANQRIIDGSAHKLGIDPNKVVSTVDKHGNTSAASIPLALAAARADGRIKRGDLVLLEAMGGGFTWGATLLRW